MKPSLIENNLIPTIIETVQQLIQNEEEKEEEPSQTKQQHLFKIIQFLNKIFSSKATGEAFIYLCKNGATTAWILQVQLGMAESTSYRALKRLRNLGLVEPVIRLPRKRFRSKIKERGGPIPIIYGLPSCENDEIAQAITTHYRTRSPKYRLPEETYQSTLNTRKIKDSHPPNPTINHMNEESQFLVEVLCHRSPLGIAGEILEHIPWGQSIKAKEISRRMGYKITSKQVAQNISHKLLLKYASRERTDERGPWKYWRIR